MRNSTIPLTVGEGTITVVSESEVVAGEDVVLQGELPPSAGEEHLAEPVVRDLDRPQPICYHYTW